MGTNTTSVLVMLFSLAILFFVKGTSTSAHVVAYYSNVSSSCRESEREALVKIREGLTDPANRLSSWIGKDCCAWKGVSCGSRKTGAHVLKLDLHNPMFESNMLGGQIPTGNQLQTLDDQSIYAGNNGLCGALLWKRCFVDKYTGDHGNVGQKKGEDEKEILQFYAGIGPGFVVGFLGVCGILHFKKSWRYAFFMFVENCYNWIVVAILVNTTWLRRKFRGGKFGE